MKKGRDVTKRERNRKTDRQRERDNRGLRDRANDCFSFDDARIGFAEWSECKSK
jgi:hypothetical protein